ncbi:hypothetical protein VEHSUH05_07765 [Veillonella denticariosi JCM 15641]|uniref:Prepilin-type cleavage/methylation domain-containing protein n=1 Tax=Veillonella denticariosi JCM 15641 TaxID=1298594 RepID=A0A2S7Z7S6_9FIRM|nr:hypothetical protein [Veillonella denticariosi]PQL19255.1 hypothetical protein VEHSUH05_07765 [Veillonella denticariosi JCM 15641]
MDTRQLKGPRVGALLVEWVITIGLVILIATLTMPMMTTPSRYTLNGATQEVVCMIKKVQFWSMLGHKSNRLGHMTFVLHKNKYTIAEDMYHHTVDIQLPTSIESQRSLTTISFSAFGLPYDETEIVLLDKESGEKNRIWISVQTGRIRWEEIH